MDKKRLREITKPDTLTTKQTVLVWIKMIFLCLLFISVVSMFINMCKGNMLKFSVSIILVITSFVMYSILPSDYN